MIEPKEISCQICGNSNFKIIKKNKKSYKNCTEQQFNEIFKASSSAFEYDQVVSCTNCFFVFINPRLPQNIIEKFYASGQDDDFSDQNLERIYTFEKSLIKLFKRLNISLKEKKCLDIGSASGAFLKACKNLNINCKGIEPNIEMVEYAKKNYKVDIKQGYLDSTSFNEKFDVIFFWDVLEHVYDINETIKICNDYLNHNGLLIINYPCYSSAVSRFLGKKWPFWLSVHLSYFNKETLNNFLHNYNMYFVDEFNHIQSLKLEYIFERAKKIIPSLKILGFILKNKFIKKLKVNYYLGQKLYVSRKK